MATRNIIGRIGEIQIGADGIIAAKIFEDDPALYNSRAIGDPVDRTGYPGQSVGAPGSTILRLLDIPTLRDEDDGPGFYVAVRGANSSWSAAVLFEAPDENADFRKVTQLDAQETMGFTKTVLGSGSTTTFDWDNSFEVDLIGGTLESMTEEEMLRGFSGYLVGDELLLAMNVVQLTPKRWRLDPPLIRGWQGTEWAVGTHTKGERFIRLSLDGIRRIKDELADLDIERLFRAVTSGTLLEDTITTLFTNTGISLKPWAPIVDTVGTVDGSNNLTINWLRRSRLRGRNGRDFFDPPLGEASESFEIEIWNDAETTVLRTLTATTNSVVYSNANQVTDFGGTKISDVHVRVYQMSADVGRGYPGRAIVNSTQPDVGDLAMMFHNLTPMLFHSGEPMEFHS